MTQARQRRPWLSELPVRAADLTQLAGRRLVRQLICRLPPGVTALLRRPAGRSNRLGDAVRRILRRGGVPCSVRTFPLVDNPAVRFVNAESLVLQQLYWFGERGWEPELLPCWRYACQRAAKIVELGANVGYFTVQGATAAPHARYLAVEPHPESARVCRQNLALNGIDWVHVLEVAATADPNRSSTELITPWGQRATPTVAFVPEGSELPRSMARRVATTIRVPTVDVRALLHGVDVLKLDVEGQEHALLAAGWSQLRTHRPTIFVELLPGTPLLRTVLSRLCAELGYRCYVPHHYGLVALAAGQLSTIWLQRAYGTNDLMLCADRDLLTAF